MANDYNLEVWMQSPCSIDGRNDRSPGLIPRVPEPGRGLTVGADVGGGGRELQIGDPVSNTPAAAEGDDDEAVCGVVGCEAGYVGLDGAGVCY